MPPKLGKNRRILAKNGSTMENKKLWTLYTNWLYGLMILKDSNKLIITYKITAHLKRPKIAEIKSRKGLTKISIEKAHYIFSLGYHI